MFRNMNHDHHDDDLAETLLNEWDAELGWDVQTSLNEWHAPRYWGSVPDPYYGPSRNGQLDPLLRANIAEQLDIILTMLSIM